jgi:hypothetical protein
MIKLLQTSTRDEEIGETEGSDALRGDRPVGQPQLEYPARYIILGGKVVRLLHATLGSVSDPSRADKARAVMFVSTRPGNEVTLWARARLCISVLHVASMATLSLI